LRPAWFPLLCVAGPGFEPARLDSAANALHDTSTWPASIRTTLESLQSLAGRLLIEEHPVDTKLTDRCGKSRELYRLAYITIRAELVAPQHVFVLARGRKNDDRDGLRARIGAHALEHVESTQLGKLEIEHDHCGHLRRIAPGVFAGAEEEIDRLAPVAGDDDFVREVGLAQRAQRKFLVSRIVLDEENYLLCDGGSLGSGQPFGRSRLKPRKSG
jgi:hypothetical protein